VGERRAESRLHEAPLPQNPVDPAAVFTPAELRRRDEAAGLFHCRTGFSDYPAALFRTEQVFRAEQR
jgi:hypothetical protein